MMGRRAARGGGTTLRSFGINGWDASTALATASGAGIAGDGTNGVSVVVAFRINELPATAQTLCRRQTGNTGWWIRANVTSFQCIAFNGTTSAIAPVRALVAGDVGKIHVAALSCDAAAVYDYFDRVQVGTSSALAGYSPAAARTTMGSTDTSTQPCTSLAILGVAGRDSHLSLADFQAICDATKAAGRLSLGAISMSHMWRAPVGGSVPSSLSDEIGTDHMTFIAGSEANLGMQAMPRTWGF